MLTIEVKIAMTTGFLAKIEQAAAARGMIPTAFVNAVLRDFLLAAEARAGAPHLCCFCRDAEANQGGLARCCACDGWGRAFTLARNGAMRMPTKAS